MPIGLEELILNKMHFIEAKNGIIETGHYEIAYNPNQYKTIKYRRITAIRRQEEYISTIPGRFPPEVGGMELINRLNSQHQFESNRRFSPGNNAYDDREPPHRVGNGRNFIKSAGENYELGYGVSKSAGSLAFTINLENIVCFKETKPPIVTIDKDHRSKIWLRFKNQIDHDLGEREYWGGWIDYIYGQTGQLVACTVEKLNILVNKYNLPLWKITD